MNRGASPFPLVEPVLSLSKEEVRWGGSMHFQGRWIDD
jgi:hypothetical protein